MNRIRNIIRKPILAVKWKGYMKKLRSKFILRALSILMMAAYAELTMAHDGVAVMDAGVAPFWIFSARMRVSYPNIADVWALRMAMSMAWGRAFSARSRAFR